MVPLSINRTNVQHEQINVKDCCCGPNKIRAALEPGCIQGKTMLTCINVPGTRTTRAAGV